MLDIKRLFCLFFQTQNDYPKLTSSAPPLAKETLVSRALWLEMCGVPASSFTDFNSDGGKKILPPQKGTVSYKNNLKIKYKLINCIYFCSLLTWLILLSKYFSNFSNPNIVTGQFLVEIAVMIKKVITSF